MRLPPLKSRLGRARCSGLRLACVGNASARSSGIQNAQAKTLIRQLRETLEDIVDARAIERAKKASGNQSRIPWAQAKKELGLS